MGKPTGFKEFPRQGLPKRPTGVRIGDFKEFYLKWPEQHARDQGARCMNCAVPFCQNGCPLGNMIPDWNDLVYKGRWEEALAALESTNNFPDFTGRICPAPCEASCVLSINNDPVTIEHIERTISDRGFEQGWIKPNPPAYRTGKRVAVIGSGPSGLAAAQQLNRAGHWVTVFERAEYAGGLLRLGIPDFKLEKAVVQRRVDQMAAEAVEFRTGVHVGVNFPATQLQRDYDAVVLTGGATRARDIPVPGRDLKGIHLAMEYLTQQNRLNAGQSIQPEERITAEGKRVVILGGGDTGADCLGTVHRQGAKVVYQIELLPKPPNDRRPTNPWPEWPQVLRLSSAAEEGGLLDYSVQTKAFTGRNGRVERLQGVRLEWSAPDASGRSQMKEISGSEFEIETDLVLLALGFVGPEPTGMLAELGVQLTGRGNVQLDKNRMTNVPGVFAAGDMARGQSLVVWAIAEGRHTAHFVDRYLMGSTDLPRVLD